MLIRDGLLKILLVLVLSSYASSIKYKSDKFANNKDFKLVDNGNQVVNNDDKLCDAPIPSLEFLGMGYDAVIGDPMGNSESHSDPGYKSSIISLPIKKWDYNKNLSTSFQIDPFFQAKCNIKGLWIIKSTSCEQRAIPSFMKTTESLYFYDNNDLDNLRNKKVVQIAIKNNTLKKTVKGSNHINVNRLVCSIYEARITIPNKLDYIKEFNDTIKNLPEEFNNHEVDSTCSVKLFIENPEDSRCSKIVKPWINFFKKFGTHIITSILVGGQIVNMESYSDVRDETVGENLENSESVSANKSDYKNLVSIKKSTLDQWSIGGVPKGKLFLGDPTNIKEEYSKWAKSVYEKPMPIHCGLEEIFKISNEKIFKQLLKPYRNAIKYYYQVLGLPSKGGNMSMGLFNSLNKLLSEINIIIQQGKLSFAHCKADEQVIVGFSLEINNHEIEFKQCEAGRDGCMGKSDNESSLVCILCSSEYNELITSIAVNDEEAKCPNNYIIALGYSIIRHKKNNLVVYCKSGEKKCGTKGRNTWIMCVNENVPGIMTFNSDKFMEIDKMILEVTK